MDVVGDADVDGNDCNEKGIEPNIQGVNGAPNLFLCPKYGSRQQYAKKRRIEHQFHEDEGMNVGESAFQELDIRAQDFRAKVITDSNDCCYHDVDGHEEGIRAPVIRIPHGDGERGFPMLES